MLILYRIYFTFSRDTLAFTAAKADNTDVRVMVRFVEDEKVSSTTFKSVIQTMQ